MQFQSIRITSVQKMEIGGDDYRYRISVFLVASHRPKYWSFHCNYCGNKVCELSGEIVYLSDMDDMNNHAGKSSPVVVRCTGRNKGEYCRMWYEFVNLAK